MDIKQVIAAATITRLRGAVFTSCLLLSATSHALPPEFTATYSAETYGMIVAQATYTLEHRENGIHFSQHSEAVGLASLFTDDILDENSELSVHGDQLLLDEYSFVQTGDKKDRDIRLSIRWQKSENDQLAGTVSGIARGETVKLETTGPVWDTLSFQIPVMLNTRENNPPQEYSILVKGELNNYLFITHGTEEIEVNGQSIRTIKVERRSDKPDEPIFFWVAPGLKNLPVRIEKWKKDKPGITMLLNTASFPADSSLEFHAAEDSEHDFE